ncbi:MAG: hypothetical protein QOF78_403 [Phycisphaerales bacterium]|jgi:hypothetical protein|nr:hypothetical protein [Phycisphaerales bacterium]
MTNVTRRIVLLAVALFVCTSGCASKPERATVIWISIDGLRPDVGDLVITLRPGYHLSDRLPLATFPREKIQASRGAHGYVPAECPEMNAFCAIWRYPDRLRRRNLGKMNAEQMHPTIARLLNIKPAQGASSQSKIP